MLFSCYLRNGIVYVPTIARRESGPIYTDIEPVAAVPLSNSGDVRHALLETTIVKNVIIPNPYLKGAARAALDSEICWSVIVVRVLSQRVNVEHQRGRRCLQNHLFPVAYFAP